MLSQSRFNKTPITIAITDFCYERILGSCWIRCVCRDRRSSGSARTQRSAFDNMSTSPRQNASRREQLHPTPFVLFLQDPGDLHFQARPQGSRDGAPRVQLSQGPQGYHTLKGHPPSTRPVLAQAQAARAEDVGHSSQKGLTPHLEQRWGLCRV